MWIIAITISGIVTFLINQTPDVGDRVTPFIVFGLFLGLTWMIRGIYGVIFGIVIGAIVGALNGSIVSSIEGMLPEFTGVVKILLILLEWLVPTMFNAFVGVVPWATSNSET
ncbi:hypothetical protein ACFLX4_01160 [Chloroflexota bacterium]